MLPFATLSSGLVLLLATSSVRAAPRHYVPGGNAVPTYQLTEQPVGSAAGLAEATFPYALEAEQGLDQELLDLGVAPMAAHANLHGVQEEKEDEEGALNMWSSPQGMAPTMGPGASKPADPAPAALPRALGQIPMTNPSFAKLVRGQEGTTALYVSSFTGNPFGKDQVYLYPDASKVFDGTSPAGATAAATLRPPQAGTNPLQKLQEWGNTLKSWLPPNKRQGGASVISTVPATADATAPSTSTTRYQTVEGSVVWPNEVTPVPPALFGGREGVVVAGGFLVPGKSNGGLWFSERTNGKAGPWTQLFAAKDQFYHRVMFTDVNKDGQLDILTCRANKPLFGGGKGELVWMEPKDRAHPAGPWVQNVLGAHCDTFFTLTDVDGDGVEDIVSAEFWGSALTLIRTREPRGSFANPADLVYTTIDDTVGHVFDVQMVDLNGDGRAELLISTHQGPKDRPAGSVYAYEIPRDVGMPGPEAWKRHTLATGFPVLLSGPGQAAPGGAQAFFPRVQGAGATTGTKPTIVLAGDASKKAYILAPVDARDPNNWTYAQHDLHTCDSTVGAIAVGDSNGDGWAEIFVPCYEKNYMAVYTYAP